MLYCSTCKSRFSETKCSPFFQTKYGAETIGAILRCTAEGVGVRATARILGLSKDAVNHVILKAGEYCANVMRQLLVDLQLTEAQMDELWSFVEKKVVKSTKRDKSGSGQPLTQKRDCWSRFLREIGLRKAVKRLWNSWRMLSEENESLCLRRMNSLLMQRHWWRRLGR